MIKKYVMTWDKNYPEPELDEYENWDEKTFPKEHILCKWEDVEKWLKQMYEGGFEEGVKFKETGYYVTLEGEVKKTWERPLDEDEPVLKLRYKEKQNETK